MSAGGDKPGDFWSRRKAAVQKAEEEEARRAQEAAEAEQRVALEEKTDAEILEELGLPDPDTLGRDDDFTAFLARTVPERLRRRALRKLWLSNPVLANLDGLNDYDEDFTDAASTGKVVKTIYEVGRGYLKQAVEEAPEAQAKDPAGEPQDLLPGQGEGAATQQEEIAALQNIHDEKGKTSIQLTQRDDEVHSSDAGALDFDENALVDPLKERPPKRRRMRFDYD